MGTHTIPKKFGTELQDWKEVCNGRSSRPFVATHVCDKCDYHSTGMGEHLGLTSKYYYCNLHGRGHASICEVPLKTNLLKYNVSHWDYFLDTHCAHRVPYNDCPYILEHVVVNAKGRDPGEKLTEEEKRELRWENE